MGSVVNYHVAVYSRGATRWFGFSIRYAVKLPSKAYPRICSLALNIIYTFVKCTPRGLWPRAGCSSALQQTSVMISNIDRGILTTLMLRDESLLSAKLKISLYVQRVNPRERKCLLKCMVLFIFCCFFLFKF